MEGINPGRRTGVCNRCLGFALALSFAFSNAWSADRKIPFNIPASTLPQAISAFNQQAGVEILYASYDSVGKIRTHPVVGVLSVPEALTQMLEGMGFTFEFENERSISLRRKIEPTGAAVVDQSLPAAARSTGEPPDATGSPGLKPEMPEVTVTGSYLHGVLDIMSPLVTVTRQEMSATPYATVQDALQALPLNSISSMSENFDGVDNFTRGTAANLRGLGYGATLALVDGRRQPLAGTASDFVDLSNIPWIAVDHIDVLPDGASALYGSDAIAGVVNVIMRDQVQGAETRIRAGTASDGAAETLVGQLFGHHWDTGKWLFAYQYSKRTALAASDRPYAANADKTSLGGRDFRSLAGNPANILDPNTFAPAFAIPAGQDGRSLTPADLLPGVVNLQNQFATYDLVPDKQIHNLYLKGSQKIGEHLELFAESRYAQRRIRYPTFPFDQLLAVPNTNAFFVDPFNGSSFLLVPYNFLDELGPRDNFGETRSHMSTVDATATLNNDWHANLSASYGRESLRFFAYNIPNQAALALALADFNRDTAFNPFGDGSYTNPETLDRIRDTQKEPTTSIIATASLVADGPLFDLPAGEIKVAIGAEHRKEVIDRDRFRVGRQRFDRQVDSVFTELSIPIVGNPDRPKAIPRLELSLASRYENYSDFGHSFNPKIGVRWAPLEWMKLRTNWGTSFKAPRLVDLYDLSNNVSLSGVISDPRSPSGQSFILAIQGNNPDLEKETARTWTAGFDFAPQNMKGFTLSFTYFDIKYKNQVIQPGFPSVLEILFHENEWPSAITRNPSASEIAAVCHRADFVYPVADCLASSPAAIIDIRLSNLASTKVKGTDLKFDYARDTRYGYFNLTLDGSYLFSFKRALTRTSPAFDILNIVNNPLALKARSTLEWSEHGKDQPGFGASATVNYTGHYRNTGSPLRPEVEAWMPLDLKINYQTASTDRWFDDMEITLNAVNVLNQNPPFVDSQYGYDHLNFMPYGRVISFNLQKNWLRR